MIEDIRKVQKEIEDLEFGLQPALEESAMKLAETRPELVPVFLTRYCLSNAQMNLEEWWKLGESLITKYNDGYVQDEKGNARELGYPKPWLREELKKNPGKFTVKDKPKKDKEL